MPFKAFKNFAEYLKNRQRYPTARVSWGARITGRSVCGKDVIVEPSSYVFASHLSDNVQVKHGCSVFESELGRNVVVYPRTVLGQVHVGDFSYAGESSVMRGVRVGRFTSIGPHFLCGYGEHPIDFASTSPVFYSTKEQCGTTFATRDYFQETAETSIGHDVWIGARVFARDGVKIGDGALVAAGAVVISDIPPYAIVGGVPAKIIRYRFQPDEINELHALEWWNWDEERLRRKQPLFAQSNIRKFLDEAPND